MSYNRKFYLIITIAVILLLGGSFAAFTFATQYSDTTSSVRVTQ